MSESSDLWLVVLGAALATTGGMAAFFIQAAWGRRQARRTVRELVAELMRSFEEVVPRIAEIHGSSQYADAGLLGRILSDLNVYDRNREHLIFIKETSLRSDIREWFSSVRTTVVLCSSLNNFANPLAAVHGEDPQQTQQLIRWAQTEIPKRLAELQILRQDAERLRDRISRTR